MNVANWLHAQALRTPQAPALYTGIECDATYHEFAARAAALAAVFASDYGVREGDRVAVYTANRSEYLVVMYAVWWLGAVLVPVNYKLSGNEAAWIIANADACVLVTDEGDQFAVDQLPDGCRELGIDTEVFEVATQNADGFNAPFSVKPNTLAWLFYTSGTTGKPKGVMLSHDNLVAMTLCYPLDVDNVSPEDAWLYAAPMSHGAGLYNFMFIRRGARHVVPSSRGFDSAEIFDLARRLDRICLFAAPTMVKRMVRNAPSTITGLRTIVYGGGPMYAADLIEAIDVLGPVFAQIYGQGESPMTITAMHRDAIGNADLPNRNARIASVGTAQSCMEVRVVDESLNDLPVGQHGQVVVRGPAVMQAYWRNEEATRSTLVDGWLCTGDIGFLGADGYLTLTDRSRDVIISGGSNIYPREVEEVLARHAGVSEVAVVGSPNSEWGEEVVAFVLPHPDHTLDAATLETWCRAEIASFKKPKRYIFCTALPRNSYGKVLKTELRVRAKADAATNSNYGT